MTRYTEDQFDAWLAAVDNAVVRMAGVGKDDLPDYCYRDAFEDGRAPAAVARSAIRAAGGF